MSSAYLLVSHGSRDPRPEVAMEELARNLQNKLASNDKTQYAFNVGTAYLELHPQPLHEQIVDFSRKAIADGCRHLKIIPLFLLPGIHVTEDIPQEVELAKKTLGEDIAIELQPYLGSHCGLQKLLTRKITDPSVGRIIVAHGSRRVEANTSIEETAISANAVAAYWAVSPSLKDIVAQLVADGKQKIAIIPYFLFPGGITDAIAESIQDLKLLFPRVNFQLYEPLGGNGELIDLIGELMQK
ncbi:sirohydrochlorin chelatase [Rivularia sp. UHCC 0363]|uniref:sirohydrochlorin chelatase n=1 Tax=Rivularia sp. UHCC 0363 TaxID=3110244 RepID=UPI002B218296|nr:sirohydrochlorin chelatase [Rivularia sp. UHCC 0363]MEA5597564.1 sirohydrochlorin chelatase [Rivularia sp. UHCC 0363]